MVNDFKELYKNISDSWQQKNDIKNKLYLKSRRDLSNEIKNLKQNKYILEVGCGNGISVRDFRSYLPNSNIDGCDISSIAIEKCKENMRETFLY